MDFEREQRCRPVPRSRPLRDGVLKGEVDELAGGVLVGEAALGDNAFVDRATSVMGLILGGGSPIGGSPIGGSATGAHRHGLGRERRRDRRQRDYAARRRAQRHRHHDPGNPIPSGCVVANVVDTPVTATAPSQSRGFVYTGRAGSSTPASSRRPH